VALLVANILIQAKLESTRLTVLKATRQLRVGKVVSLSDFVAIDVHGNDLTAMNGLFIQKHQLNAFHDLPLAETLEQGQLLMQRSFEFARDGRLRDAIGPDQRAITVVVKDNASAVAYVLRPGDIVDIWATGRGGDVKNLIRGVRVLSLGDASNVRCTDGSGYHGNRTVTVVVPTAGVHDLYSGLESSSSIFLALDAGSNPR
jgi:Flp pilus assembly protein CpaB